MIEIPEVTLARIQALNQDIWHNTDPMMRAVIVKVNRTLDISTVRSADRLGSIDVDVHDGYLWLISVVDRAAVVTAYDLAALNYAAPGVEFTLDTETVDAAVRGVSIVFELGVPRLTWIERDPSYDTVWTVLWDGTGIQPAGTKLMEAAR